MKAKFDNSMILWHDLVDESLNKTGLQFSDSVHQYLVLTLQHFTKKTELAAVVVATAFLQNVNIETTGNAILLRDVGDQCLLLSGLFPDRAKRKRVSETYFSDLGKHAYYVLSFSNTPWQSSHSLFLQLFDNFSDLVTVLRAMRQLDRRLLH